MLKGIGRLLVILAVVALITAGVYLLFDNNPYLAGTTGHPDRGIAEADGSFTPRGDRPFEGFEQGLEGRELRGEHGHEGGFSAIGLLGIAKNLGIIATITLAVWALSKLGRLLKRRPFQKIQTGEVSLTPEG